MNDCDFTACFFDYHAHQAHAGGGYLCSERRRDWPVVTALAHDSGMIPCVGVHPWHAAGENPETLREALDVWLQLYPEAQVGESGLDGKTASIHGWEVLLNILDVQADAAWKHARLLQLHGTGAAGRLLDWARRRSRAGKLPRIHLHAWNGSPDMARAWLELGATFSAGVREWKSPKAAARYEGIPFGRFFAESDADATSWPQSLRLWEEWRSRRTDALC